MAYQLIIHALSPFSGHKLRWPIATLHYIFLFIAEYMEQGAIFDFLHQNEFNSDRNLMWARQIAAGKYM